jgi:hypothetical protein
MELSTQREKSAHTAPSITSLCRCAEAVLYAGAEELLMPDDIRWCPVDAPFIAPTVSSAQIDVSAGATSKSDLDENLDKGNASFPSAVPGATPTRSGEKKHVPDLLRKNEPDARRTDLLRTVAKGGGVINDRQHAYPVSSKKLPTHRVRSKSVDQGQRRNSALPKQRRKVPRPTPPSCGIRGGRPSPKSHLLHAPPINTVHPRPPVPPGKRPKRGSQRKPQPPPKSAKDILENQLRAMRDRSKKNQEKIRETKVQFEMVRNEQKELERKLFADLRQHLKSGEEERLSRPVHANRHVASGIVPGATAVCDSEDDSEESEGSTEEQVLQQSFKRHVSTAASRNRSMQRCANCKRVFRSVATLGMHQMSCDLVRKHGIIFKNTSGAAKVREGKNTNNAHDHPMQDTGEHGARRTSGLQEEETQRRLPSVGPSSQNEEKRRWKDRYRGWRSRIFNTAENSNRTSANWVPLNEFFMRNYGPWSSEHDNEYEATREPPRHESTENVQEARQARLREQEAERARKDTENDKIVIALHDVRWREFAEKAKHGEAIRYSDVPWLPTLLRHASDLKNCYSRRFEENTEPFDVIGVSEEANDQDKKAALRAASLRWHPDKFLQAYGKLLEVGDYERIMVQVNIMSQRVNQLKARFEEGRKKGKGHHNRGNR